MKQEGLMIYYFLYLVIPFNKEEFYLIRQQIREISYLIKMS